MVDPYDLRHLISHLVERGRLEELHGLLGLVSANGGNFWFNAHQSYHGLRGYSDDVQRGLNALGADHKLQFGRVVRYGIALASVRDIASNVWLPLVLALVKEGLWQPSKAISYIDTVGDPKDRARALVNLYFSLPDEFKTSIRPLIEGVPDRESRINALVDISGDLDRHQLESLFLQIQELPEQSRVAAVVQLARHLDEFWIGEVFNVVSGDFWGGALLESLYEYRRKYGYVDPTDPDARAAWREALERLPREVLIRVMGFGGNQGSRHVNTGAKLELLRGVINYLPDHMLLESFLWEMGDNYNGPSAEALSILGPRLNEDLLDRALERTRESGNRYTRNACLNVLLPQQVRLGHMEAALKGVEELEPDERAEALGGIAVEAIRAGQQETGLQLLSTVINASILGNGLCTVSTCLLESQFAAAVELARGIWVESYKGMALAALSARMENGKEIFCEGLLCLGDVRRLFVTSGRENLTQGLAWAFCLEYAASVGGKKYSDETFECLLGGLDSPVDHKQQDQFWELALATLRHIAPYISMASIERVFQLESRFGRRWGQIGASLAPRLTPELVMERWQQASAEEELAALIPRVPKEYVEEFISQVTAVWTDSHRPKLLAAVAPRLPRELLESSYSVAASIRDEYAQAPLLARLGRELPEDERAAIFDRSLGVLERINDEGIRGAASERVAKYLELPQILQLMGELPSLRYDTVRLPLLECLLARLVEIGEPGRALRYALDFYDHGNKFSVLATLCKYLPGDFASQVLDQVESPVAARLLSTFAARIPESEVTRALGLIGKLEDPREKGSCLIALSDRMPQSLLQEAMDLARNIEDSIPRLHAMVKLSCRIGEREARCFAEMALGELEAVGKDNTSRVAQFFYAEGLTDCLCAMAPLWSQQQLEQVIGFFDPQASAPVLGQVLAALSRYMQLALLKDCIARARNMSYEQLCKAYAGLAARLALLRTPEEALALFRGAISFDRLEEYIELLRVTSGRERNLVVKSIAQHRDLSENNAAIELIAPLLGAREVATVIDGVIAIQNKWNRIRPLSCLMRRLVNLSPQAAFECWHHIGPVMFSRARGDLLLDLEASIPVIANAGGLDEVRRTVAVVQESCGWWP